MKYLLILIIFIIPAGMAFGDDYLDNHPLTTLRAVQADPQEKTAQITATNGDTAQVTIGDTIGQQGAIVVKISRVFVKVRTESGSTKLPVISGSSQSGNHIIFK